MPIPGVLGGLRGSPGPAPTRSTRSRSPPTGGSAATQKVVVGHEMASSPPPGSMVSAGRPRPPVPFRKREVGTVDHGAQGGGRAGDGRCRVASASGSANTGPGRWAPGSRLEPFQSRTEVPTTATHEELVGHETPTRPGLVEGGGAGRARSVAEPRGWGGQPLTVTADVGVPVLSTTAQKAGEGHDTAAVREPVARGPGSAGLAARRGPAAAAGAGPTSWCRRRAARGRSRRRSRRRARRCR